MVITVSILVLANFLLRTRNSRTRETTSDIPVAFSEAYGVGLKTQHPSSTSDAKQHDCTTANSIVTEPNEAYKVRDVDNGHCSNELEYAYVETKTHRSIH